MSAGLRRAPTRCTVAQCPTLEDLGARRVVPLTPGMRFRPSGKVAPLALAALAIVALAAATALAKGSDRLHRGSLEDDVIRGGASADRVYGFQGKDQLFGYGGGETIVAGKGRDLVVGGNGDDRVDVRDGFVTSSSAAEAPTPSSAIDWTC